MKSTGQKNRKQGSITEKIGSGGSWVLILLGVLIVTLRVFNDMQALQASAVVKQTVTVISATSAPSKQTTTLTSTTISSLVGCVQSFTTLKIQINPNIESDIIGGLPPGICVSVIGRTEGVSWSQIKTSDGLVGWVPTLYLKVQGNPTNLPVVISPEIGLTATKKIVNSSTAVSQPSSQSSNPTNNNSSGASAICNDGTYSYSTRRSGTCSHHGGVKEWLKTLPP